MKMKLKTLATLLVALTIVAIAMAVSVASVTTYQVPAKSIPSPEEFLGYPIGENYKLTYWSTMVNYFTLVANLSDRVELFEIGKTLGGRPLVLLAVSSPENLAKLEYYRGIANKLADPRLLNPDDVQRVVEEGKAIVFLMGDQHSPEVDWSEASLQLVYELATRNDEVTRRILENVVVLILPSANPDGHDVYRDWYYKYSKTEYAGTSPPVWGVPVSHDNNRDWFSLNLNETRAVTSAILYWKPQVIVDNHMMGSYGYRMFIPPETDPINPNIHPLIQQLKFSIGGSVVTALEREGLYGVTMLEIYDLFYPGYTDSSWSLRNVVSMTWEIARGNGADPVYISPDQLSKAAKTQASYHMHPWPGGWWTLKDQVRYRLVATWALLDYVARNKETVLLSTYWAAKSQVDAGMNEPPYAFLIPKYGKDPAYQCKLVDKLIALGIEVRELKEPFNYGGRVFPAGTYVVLMNQPYRGLAKTLLETQVLKVEYFYDVTAWTLGYLWNLEVVPVNDKGILYTSVSAPLKACTPAKGEVVSPATYAYVLRRVPTSISALNELLSRGLKALFYAGPATTVDNVTLEPGSILIPVNNTVYVSYDFIKSIAEKYNVKVYALNTTTPQPVYEVAREPKVALYWPNRYGRMSMNAGWLKMILGEYNFKFDVVTCDNITTVDLNAYDVVIIPDETPASRVVTGITGYPLKNGIGVEGVEKLKKYVEQGGVLVVLNEASLFTVDYGVVSGVKVVTGATIPGTILRVHVNTTHPLGFGLNELQAVYAWRSPAFEAPSSYVVARYPDNPEEMWLSGFLKGHENYAGKATLLDIPLGKGHVVLFGFDPTYRAQTPGTYMFLFNAIYYGVIA